MKIKYFAAIAVVAFLVILYIAFGRQALNLINKAYVPAGWKKHYIKYGPSLIAPDKWEFKFNRKNGSVLLNGLKKERVFIWPLFSRKYMNARTAKLTLVRLEDKIWPGAKWKISTAVSKNSVRISGYKNNNRGIALLSWVNTPKGTAICIFAADAPTKTFKTSVTVFARIFRSFHASGPAPLKKQPAVKYLTWQDPRERAFTLQVPESWKITGGAFRYAPVDVRIEVRSISPDNQMLVQLGDSSIPVYTMPNQWLSMGGYREGSYYWPGYGVREMVLRYLSGLQYAHYYAINYISRVCSGVHITYSKNRRDISGAANRNYMDYNLPIRLSTGEARFSCMRNGATFKGYIFAGTYRTSSMWGVMYLYFAVAPPTRMNQAMSVLSHEIGTFKKNPQWVAMNEHIAMSASRIVTETNNKIEHMISSSYKYSVRVGDEIDRRRENAILGEVDVVDKETGEDYKVDSGSNYYWMSHGETIVGTDTDSVPNHDVNFKKMLLRP